MFSSAHQLGSRRPSVASYRDVNASTAIEGATPHRLVSLLYQSVGSEIAAARGAIARSDIGEKGRAISHAVRIIEEGLLAPLDLTAGGAIAINLRDLYQYVVYRLTMANLNTDDAALAECARLIEVLREGWDAIAGQVDMPARAAA
ncbi:MAG TPA: flagellar export chaperone FliS [Caldimonas sp.]